MIAYEFKATVKHIEFSLDIYLTEINALLKKKAGTVGKGVFSHRHNKGWKQRFIHTL